MDTVGFQNVGPHVVKVPPSSVYIRSDKTELQKLKCMAVGEYPIKYQWIKYSKVRCFSQQKDINSFSKNK